MVCRVSREGERHVRHDDQVFPGLELEGGPAELGRYAGKAIAVVDGEVEASGTWEEVLKLVDVLHLEHAVFAYVPAGVVAAGFEFK